MSLSFKLEKEHLSNGSTVAIAYLSGFIDIRTVKIFESEALNPLLNEGSKYLILNFTNVGYMNSTGLGVLVKVQDKYKDADGDLILVNVPQKIFDLFKMLGMDTILKVKNTNQEALESLPFPLLPQIPDIPADSSDMLAESGDMLSPPPMNIPSNAGGNIFMTPDTPSPSPIVISSPDEQANAAPGNQGIEFPAPDNFGGFNPFEISGKDANVGEATSIDNSALQSDESSGITISANDNEFDTVVDESQVDDDLQVPNNGIEISDKSPGISDTWEAEMGPGAGIDISEAESMGAGIDLSSEAEPVNAGIDLSSEMEPPQADIDLSNEAEPVNAGIDLSNEMEPPGAGIDISGAVEALENEAQMPYDEEEDEDDEFDDDMAISELDMTAEDDLDDIVDMEDHFRSGMGNQTPQEPIADGIAFGKSEAEAPADEPIISPVGQISDIVTHVDEDDDESSAEMAIDDEFEEKKQAVVEENAEEADEVEPEEAEEAEEEIAAAEETMDEPQELVAKAKKAVDGEISNDLDGDSPDLELKDSEDSIPAETFPDSTTQMPQMPCSHEQKEMEDIVDAVNEVDATEDVDSAHEESSLPIVPVSGTTEKMDQVEKPQPRVETYYKRKMAIRYYEKMNPLKSFPLLVSFSKEKLQKIVMDNVAQQQASSPIKVKKSKPEVIVTPSLKGCVVYPSSMCIDITPEMTTAEFWITPIIEGEIAGHIEVTYEGKVVEKISLTSSCAKQTWAKISAVGAIAIPMVSFLLEGLNWNLPQTAWNLIPKLVQQIESSIGLSNFGVIMSIVSIVAGSIMYSMNKPKEAEELEKFFSTN